MADPFSTLGIEPCFDLDLAQLEQRHRELSRALHPDRYVGRPSTERRQALGRAIEVNEAWRVLKDPVRRAEAVLTAAGVRHGELAEPQPDPELLMDVLEQREELSGLRAKRDEAGIRKVVQRMKERELGLVSELSASLAELTRAELTAAAREELRERTLRKLGELRYSRRFLEEAAAIEDELFDAV
jgi:molecular chaperone HscB